MSDRFLAIHNVDLATRDQKPGEPAIRRVKSGTTLSASELTDEERDSLLGLGAIREASPEEEKAAEAREQQDKDAKRYGEGTVQRQRLLQKQARERGKIEEKFDAQKRDELAKLEDGHAKDRAELEAKLSGSSAAAE